MRWLERLFYLSLASGYLVFAALAFVVVLPFLLICLICLLTPPPFTMIVNLIFPLFFFMGPNGARTCLDGLLSAVRFLINKASEAFRASHDLST